MSVVDTANKLLGKVSYSFGASSINKNGGVGDCSSFTQFVFKENGINIGRTANEQYSKGKTVKKDELKAGDLVFFQGTYSTGGASHVGIYVGNGKFIHNSSGKKGTVVSDLNSPYYKSHWLGAKRYNGSESDNLTSTDENNSTENNSGFFKGLAKKITLCILILVCIIVAYISFSTAFDLENPFKR